MTHAQTRESIIPKSSIKVVAKIGDGVVYLFTNTRGRPSAMAFHGTVTTKPDWHYSFANPAQREAYIRRFFEGRAARTAAQAERKAKRFQPHRLERGHVLVSVWGYEQTNVNFYQVIALIGANTVELREMTQIIGGTDDGAWQGKAMPRMDDFRGEPFRRRVNGATGMVRISSSQTADVWDGRALSWSAYH